MVGTLVRHQVGESEDLAAVALRYRLAVEHLAFANGFPITIIDAEEGARLFVPSWRILPTNPPANGIVVNLPERLAYFFRNGAFVSHYPLSIGDEQVEGGRFQTPTGNFRVIEKVKNPTWYPPSWAPDRRPVAPGPKNPLGERWIGLSLPRTGIHGTNDPLNIGNSVTHGCMRTHPGLLNELYDKVRVGDVVRIEYQTARVGRDASGKLYVANFPDVYKKKPSLAAAQNLLQRAGLRPTRDNFQEILKLQLGMPVRVDGRGSLYQEWCQQAGVSAEIP